MKGGSLIVAMMGSCGLIKVGVRQLPRTIGCRGPGFAGLLPRGHPLVVVFDLLRQRSRQQIVAEEQQMNVLVKNSSPGNAARL